VYKPTSKVQSLAGEAIRFWFAEEDVLENHRPYWLFGMELDFYIQRLKIGFEIQGEQHRQFVAKFHRSPEDFQRQCARDDRKCKLNRVVLVEVFSLLELAGKVRACVRGRRFDNLPAGLYWKMKEYHQAQTFISENQWVTEDVNGKKKKRK